MPKGRNAISAAKNLNAFAERCALDMGIPPPQRGDLARMGQQSQTRQHELQQSEIYGDRSKGACPCPRSLEPSSPSTGLVFSGTFIDAGAGML